MSEIVVIIRPSFMKFCKDGCRAALLNHILYWIAKKAKGQPQPHETTWYATTDELTKQMANAWGSEKVRQEVNNLVKAGLIGRGKNPKHGADRTKYFSFGQEQMEKLLELCQEHNICPACIDLPDEVEHFLKTVKQIWNHRNAKPESMICFTCAEHEHFWDSGLANLESVRALTKISTKTIKTKITERKNDEPEQNLNVSASEGSSSHSSTYDPFISEEVKQTYRLICQELYRYNPPKLEGKNIEHFTKLAQEVRTVEDIQNLVAFCKKEQPVLQNSIIHPANLTYWLDGWLLTRIHTPESQPEPQEPIVSDEELAEEVSKTVDYYKTSDRFEDCFAQIQSFSKIAGLSNYKTCEKIVNMRRKVSPEKYGIDDFMEELRQDLYW